MCGIINVNEMGAVEALMACGAQPAAPQSSKTVVETSGCVVAHEAAHRGSSSGSVVAMSGG